MTITLKQLLFILGGALLAVGLVLGLTPISADGGSCGGVFTGDKDMWSEGLYRSMSNQDPFAFQAACEDARASRTTLTWALLAPGILLAGAGFFVPSGPSSAGLGSTPPNSGSAPTTSGSEPAGSGPSSTS